jgi:hypothetical protein
MTLPQWSVLINALIAALMVGYGFWIRDVVSQQLKLKDSSIESLQAALTAKDAEISRLKEDKAPNIVKAYSEMREHADQMTGEVAALQKKIQTQVEKNEVVQLLAESSGLNLGERILIDKLGRFLDPKEAPPAPLELRRLISETSDAISENTHARLVKARKLLD